MSTPGWYPDPAGGGGYRWWDGSAWTARTTPSAGASAPGGPGPARPGGRGPGGTGRGGGRRGGGPGVVVAVVVGVVVLAVVLGVLLVPRLLGDADAVDPGPAPSPTISAWDETSRPTPTPTPTPTPSPTPSGSATPPPTEDCPVGDPGARQQHPSDGLVHGGGLAFEPVPGWEDYAASGYSWTYDTAGQVDYVVDTWIATTAVGAVAIVDGFESPEQAAADFLACTTTSAFYRNVTDVTELRDEPITVDGRQGWWIRAEIRVSGEQVEGDVSDIIVVDNGDGESLSFYTSCAPIGDTDRIALIDAARESLRVG